MANDTSGIMALPAMDQQQGPGPAAQGPEAQMVFDSMRQNFSPKEISDELLATAAEADPQAVAEFKAALEELDVPPEILDLLDRLVDEILANPDNYEAIKEKYRAQGVTEDILPEEFDAELFGALNLAIDQLRGKPAAPMEPQQFAEGGIANLSPVAKAIAAQGRNGDTMLAHITPAEARMLKKHGGSGTINPATGLPEFANIFSRIGKAVKKFAGSTVGRLVIGTALFMVAGPAAAQFLTLSSPMAVAGVSGFVAGAGTTLLAGGNLRDALKAGAIGGLTAGAVQGVTGMGPTPAGGAETATTAGTSAPSLPGAPSLPSAPAAPALPTAEALPTLPGSTAPPLSAADPFAGARFAATPTVSATPTPGAPFELSGRLDLGAGTRAPAANVLAPSVGQSMPVAAPAAAPLPTVGQVQPPVDYGLVPARDAAAQMVGTPQTATQVTDSMRQGFTGTPSYMDRAKDLYTKYLSPSGIEAQGIPAAEKAGREAITSLTARLPDATPAMKEAAYQAAYKNAMPGVVAKYGPMAAAGLGIMGLAGGFRTQPPPESPLSALLTGGPGSANYLLANNPAQFYIQYLPGVSYTSGRPRFAEGGIVDVPAFAEGGKVLSAAQKIELANALTAAQQSNNFTAFNQKIKDMGVNQGDLLSNFPAINQAAINQAVSKGAVVPGASTSTSTSSGSSSANDYGRAAEYFRLNPDVRNAYETQVRGKGANPMTPEQYMDFHYNTLRLTGDAPGTVRQGYVAAGASSPGTSSGKNLTTQEKFGLADALIKAQQSGDYGAFNEALQGFGLTQADLLSNFPNINLTGIQEHTGRGVVAPMYKGDVATGVRGLTEGQRTELGNIFLKAQETGDYGEFNKLLSLYQLQPADLVKLYPNLSLEKIQQFQQDQAGKVTFPAPRVDKVFGVGTAAPTQVEVPSATLRTGQRPTDARSESIRQYLGGVGPGAKIESIVSAMDRADISPEQVADVMGMGYAPVQAQYHRAKNAMILGGYDVDPWTGKRTPVAPTAGIGALPVAGPRPPYEITNNLLSAPPGPMPPKPAPEVLPKPTPEVPPTLMNTGGIADLARGGYPRRTGQIDGPGTETSDSIPAMLSDGEFVMTARAVRGAGNGDRRAGAKKMYALMHRLEKNAARG